MNYYHKYKKNKQKYINKTGGYNYYCQDWYNFWCDSILKKNEKPRKGGEDCHCNKDCLSNSCITYDRVKDNGEPIGVFNFSDRAKVEKEEYKKKNMNMGFTQGLCLRGEGCCPGRCLISKKEKKSKKK